jgi:hypothetical protein
MLQDVLSDGGEVKYFYAYCITVYLGIKPVFRKRGAAFHD